MVVGTIGRLTVNHHPMKGCLHRRPPARWFCHGTILVLLCAVNIRFVPRGMILHDRSMTTTTSTPTTTASLDGTRKAPPSGLRRTEPPEDTFCQTIQVAHEYLEPAHQEPRRNMAHVFVVNSGHLPLLQTPWYPFSPSRLNGNQLSWPWMTNCAHPFMNKAAVFQS